MLYVVEHRVKRFARQPLPHREQEEFISQSLPMWNKPSSYSGPPSSTTTLIPSQHVIVLDHNRISCCHSISHYSTVHTATRAQVLNVWRGSGALNNLVFFSLIKLCDCIKDFHFKSLSWKRNCNPTYKLIQLHSLVMQP